jgi:hypothetical protein
VLTIFGLAQNLIQNQAEGTARLAEKEQSSQLSGQPKDLKLSIT